MTVIRLKPTFGTEGLTHHPGISIKYVYLLLRNEFLVDHIHTHN